MPLNTQIIRNGEPLKVRWSEFHVAAMTIAASLDDPTHSIFADKDAELFAPWSQDESVPGEWRGRGWDQYPEVPCPIGRMDAFNIASYPIMAATRLNDGAYVLTKEHKFVDCIDGEVLHLLPGDELRACRS